MDATIALYDADAYAQEFTAKVVGVTEDGIILDRTLFFPEQGGQKSDLGILSCNDVTAEISDVKIAGGVITHYIHREDENAPLPFHEGEEVTGRIDFTRRFDFMQNHSGEHILSGTAHRMWGCDNVGFRLKETEMTLDFNRLLTDDEIRALEDAANDAVFADKEILVSFPSGEEAAGIPYRSKKEIEGQLRLVTIPDVDICACCAPHVHRTGEIGLIKIVKRMKNRGGTRLTALCGYRALKYLRTEHEILHEASDMLSTSAENVPDRIRRFKEEIYALKGEVKTLKAAEGK